MSVESESADYSPREDLGILEEGPTETDLATEPSEEASEEVFEEDTQTDGVGDDSPPQEDAVEGAESPEEAYVDPGTDNVFEFMGKEYASVEDAEQALSSWEGRIRAEQERRQESDKRLDEYYRYVQDAHSKNEELYRQLQEKQATTAEKAEEKQKEFLEDDKLWEEIQSIQQIAADKGYDPQIVGMRVLAQKMDAHYKDQLSSVKEELSAPIEAQQDQQRFETAAAELFVWAQSQENEAGESFYPELTATDGVVQDELFTQNMYSAWQKLATENPQFGFSPEGVDYAYRLAREFHDSAVSPQGETYEESEISETVEESTGVAPARGANGRFVESQDAAAEGASSGSDWIDPTKEPVPESEEAAMMQRMGSVRTVKPGKEDLGFYE